MKSKGAAASAPPNLKYHAPDPKGVDVSQPPMFGGKGPTQTQGAPTSPLGVYAGEGQRVAKPRG